MFLVCEIGLGCGGLGDRLVGLVSAILLAKLSKRTLVIRWDKPNMDAIWENQFRADPNTLRPRKDDIHWNYIDQRFKYRRELTEAMFDKIWPRHRNVYLQGNQEIASFVYGDPDGFIRDVTQVYADLFTKYLLVKGAPPFYPSPESSLGIQIRAGDTHMKAGHVEYISAEALKKNILPAVVSFIRKYPRKFASIFVTSDVPNCAALLQEQLEDTAVIVNLDNQQLVTHVDRPGASLAGLRKTVADLQTLARCQVQLFSWVSNFGRVAALMGMGIGNPELHTIYLHHEGVRIVPVTSITALTTKHQQVRDLVTPPPPP